MSYDFSYENDIAPVKGKYFQTIDSGVANDQQRLHAKAQILSVESQMEDRRLDREKRRLGNSLLAQRHEVNRMALNDARDRARKMRESNERIGSIVSELDTINNDDTLSLSEKIDLTGQLKLDNIDEITTNPTISNAFKVIDTRNAERSKKNAASNAIANNLISAFASKGNTSAVAKILDGTGQYDTPTGQAILSATDEVKSHNDAVAISKGINASNEANAEALGDQRKQDISSVKESRDILKSLERKVVLSSDGLGNKEDKGLSKKGKTDLVNLARKMVSLGYLDKTFYNNEFLQDFIDGDVNEREQNLIRFNIEEAINTQERNAQTIRRPSSSPSDALINKFNA